MIGARRGSKTETSAAGPTNVASGRRCRGINTVALRVAAIVNGYSDGLWTPIDNGRTPERRCRFRHVRTGAALAWERLPAHTGRLSLASARAGAMLMTRKATPLLQGVSSDGGRR